MLARDVLDCVLSRQSTVNNKTTLKLQKHTISKWIFSFCGERPQPSRLPRPLPTSYSCGLQPPHLTYCQSHPSLNAFSCLQGEVAVAAVCCVLYLVICWCSFQVRFPDNLGDIYKVRVGFANDTDQDENWLLDSVNTSAFMSVSPVHFHEHFLGKSPPGHFSLPFFGHHGYLLPTVFCKIYILHLQFVHGIMSYTSTIRCVASNCDIVTRKCLCC